MIMSMVFVLLAVSTIPFANAQTFSIIDGIDLSGGDIYSTPSNAPDVAHCQATCVGIPGCVGFVWNSNSLACFPKNNSAAWQINLPWPGASGFLNGLTQTSISVQGYDFNGGDMPGQPSILASEADCASNCLQTPGCIWYTYLLNNQNCWLKNGTWTAMTNSQRNSGVFRAKTANCNSYIPIPHFDFNGGDIPNQATNQASVQACADHCAQTTGCLGFTFANDGSNQCWVKNGGWQVKQTVNSVIKIAGLMTGWPSFQ